MAKLPIDLSRFKKAHADKESTTLVHPEGHSIKLAHKMLSPKMRSQLAALPMSDGGNPKLEESKKEPDSKPSFLPLQDVQPSEHEDSDPDNDAKPHKKLDFNYDDGGYVDPNKQKTVGQIINYPGAGPSPSPKPKQYAEGGQPSVEDMEAIDQPGQKDQVFRAIGNAAQNQVEKANQQDRAMWQSANQGDYSGLANNATTMAMGTLGPVENAEAGFNDAVQVAKDQLNSVFSAAQRGEANMDNVKAAQQAYSRALAIAERHASQVAKPRMADGGDIKDPTQEHLMRGDRLPNSVEKSYVKEAKSRLKMADGGEAAPDNQDQTPVVNNINAAPQAQPAAPPQAPQIDPRVARMRELYNIRVATSQPASMAGGFGPEGTGPEMALKSSFGPNGEPPADFDSTAWTKAEQDFMQESQRKSSMENAQRQSALEQNQVRARAGLPMVQVPGDQMPENATVTPKNMSLAGPATEPSQVMPNTMAPSSDNQNIGGMGANQPNIMHGYQQQLGGIQAEASATGALGQQQAAELQSSIQKQEAARQQYQAHYDKLDQEYNNFIEDYKNSHIDPKHYLNSMGTGEKIQKSIGLLLGGFGAAAGQGNAAINFINSQIDRDIDAQKMEMGKKQNLLTANFRQFGNLKDATEMTKAMQQGIVANQLQMAAAKATSPLAKARAMQAAGQLESNIAPTLNIMAAMRMGGNAGGQGGPSSPETGIQQSLQMLRYFAPDRAKEMESRYIPGAGMAAVPVPQEVRDKITAKQNLGSALNRLAQWSQAHSGTLLDRSAVNEGKAMAAEVQSMYRNAINGGVFKEGEQKFIDRIINSDPTAFFNSIRVMPALKEVMTTNAMQLHGLHNSVGLQPFQGAPGVGAGITNKQYRPKSFKPAGK